MVLVGRLSDRAAAGQQVTITTVAADMIIVVVMLLVSVPMRLMGVRMVLLVGCGVGVRVIAVAPVKGAR